MASAEELQRENEMMRFIVLNYRNVANRSWMVQSRGEEGCLGPGSFWTTEAVAWGVKRHAVVMGTGMGMQVIELDENGEAKDTFTTHRHYLTRIENPFPAGHRIYHAAESWRHLAEAARLFDKIVGH